MAKKIVYEIDVTTEQAQQNIEELNKSLDASKDYVIGLENELNDLEKQLAKTPKTQLAAQTDLRKKIEKTKVAIKDEKLAISEIKREREKYNDVLKQGNKEQVDLTASTGLLDKATGGLASKLGSSIKTLKSVTTGFKTLRGAIISTGIGALVIAIGSLIAAFKSSEEGQNKFAKLMGVIGAITGNFVDLLADLGEKIIWAFENPRQAINDFVKLLRENIINRFEGLIELVPKLGQSIQLLFKGQFAEAGKVAVDAVGKVTLGVESVTDKVKEATQAVVEFTKEQIAEGQAAAKVADMRAQADKIERQLLIDRSKLESEIAQLRLKARQEDQFSAEERKQALLDAQALEDELLDKETEFLTLRRDAQLLENTFSRTNKENLDKEAQAIAAVNNQVAQRANTARQLQRELNTINKQIETENNKRLKEEEDAQKESADKAKELEKEKNDFLKAQREALALDLDAKAQLEITKTTEKYDALIEQAKKFGGDVTALEQAKADSILNIEQKTNQDKEKLRQQDLQGQIAQMEAEKAIQNAKFGLLSQFGGFLKEVAGESKELQIAAVIAQQAGAIGQIVSNTGIANAKAVAASPLSFGQPWVGINSISAGLSIATAVASGIKSIQQIKNAENATTAPSAAPIQAPGGRSAATPTPPQINTIGTSGISQLAQTIQQKEDKPIKAYVVAGEVTTAQALERNAVKEAGI